jgi:hypothetical protein
LRWPCIAGGSHVLGCGVAVAKALIPDNGKHELDRFTMRKSGVGYDDDSRLAYFDANGAIGGQSVRSGTLAFDMLPEGWEAVK